MRPLQFQRIPDQMSMRCTVIYTTSYWRLLRLFPMSILLSAILLGAIRGGVAQDVPNSWPQNYSGIPSGGFSPQWQKCKTCPMHGSAIFCLYNLFVDFEVTEPLPNITEPLPRSFAGNIATNRPGHQNSSLFFWGFEKEIGSLTAPADHQSDEPWLIWLNGGPGASRYVRWSIKHSFPDPAGQFPWILFGGIMF